MAVINSNRALLFIEPSTTASEHPVDDGFTKAMTELIQNYSYIGSRYRGVHVFDGMNGGNYVIVLPDGIETNPLCVAYLRWYRHEVPLAELQKLRDLAIKHLPGDWSHLQPAGIDHPGEYSDTNYSGDRINFDNQLPRLDQESIERCINMKPSYREEGEEKERSFHLLENEVHKTFKIPIKRIKNKPELTRRIKKLIEEYNRN